MHDLLLLLAGAHVRLANWDRETLIQALDLLDRAERISEVAPCQALWIDRAAYLQHLGDSLGAAAARTRGDSIPVTMARDHYLLAMTSAREHRYSLAISHLNEAVRLNPRDYWSWMQRGLCHQELGETALAIGDFGTCVGLRPSSPGGITTAPSLSPPPANARKHSWTTREALDLDSNLLAARLNCGVLYLELKQYSKALAALETVLRSGRDDAALHSGLGIALEGLGRHEEADKAFALADLRTAAEPPKVRQRIRRAYGFAVADRLPARARAAFTDVLRDNPDDPEALYGCGMLHDRKGEQREALSYFSRALEAAPAFEEARRFRAVVLARSGDYQAAQRDINVCLSNDSSSGATYYAAACVAALQAEAADPKTAVESAEEALQMLRAAFERGYGFTIASEDQDLKGIRSAGVRPARCRRPEPRRGTVRALALHKNVRMIDTVARKAGSLPYLLRPLCCADCWPVGRWRAKPLAPGLYVPERTAGITRVEDLPRPLVVSRSRNYRSRWPRSSPRCRLRSVSSTSSKS